MEGIWDPSRFLPSIHRCPAPPSPSPTLVPAPRAWEDPSSVPGRAHADAGRAGDGRYGCGKAEVTFFRPSFFGVHLKNHDFFTAVLLKGTKPSSSISSISVQGCVESNIISTLITGGQFATTNQPRLMK